MQTSYHLMDEGGPSTPSEKSMELSQIRRIERYVVGVIISLPMANFYYKEQANALFVSTLHRGYPIVQAHQLHAFHANTTPYIGIFDGPERAGLATA